MGTPFAYLFHTPFAAYAYDVGKNNVIRLSEELYSYLQAIKENDTVCLAE